MSKINIEERFIIPTNHMQEFATLLYRYAPEDCIRLTKFYDDCVQLFWPHDKHLRTVRCLFLQTGQGEFKLVVAEDIEKLFGYSDKNIPATCIRCDVPANELASFIAVCHRHHNQRVEMLCMLADIYFPSKDNAA
ncbi:hypothetical protein ACE414_03010 [Alteromonas macleodii]|uniref:hypothetical protein n=1 Tax=Alteromonas macleodii TaxID=28108 RepID=UPI0036696125